MDEFSPLELPSSCENKAIISIMKTLQSIVTVVAPCLSTYDATSFKQGGDRAPTKPDNNTVVSRKYAPFSACYIASGKTGGLCTGS